MRPRSFADAAADVRCFGLGGRTILFSERLQQLFELNDSAALIWRALSGGESPHAIAKMLTRSGIPPREAAGFVSDAIAEWSGTGLLVPHGVIERSRQAPDMRLHLRIGGFACRLDVHAAAGDPLPGIVHSLFAQFGTEEAVRSRSIAILRGEHGYFLLSDEVVTGMFPTERIVPELKALLTERLAASTGDGSFLVHAALLDAGGKGVLLTGPPGAGKTTLAVALAAQGWGYAADDVLYVSREGELEGIRFSPASKSGAWRLLQHHVPRLPQLPVHVRRDGQEVRYVPIGGWPAPATGSLAWGFLLARCDGAEAAIEPVDPLAFLGEVLQGAFSARHRLDGEAMGAMIDRLSVMQCGRLVYSKLDDAVGLLRGTARA